MNVPPATLDRGSLEAVACPLCHANDDRPWGAENGYTAVKCGGCGLVYVNPRPRAEDVSEANRLGQHRVEGGALHIAYKHSRRKIDRYRRRIRRNLPAMVAGGPVSWLDVGAGYGELVEALTKLLPAGSVVRGIEPMEPKARSAKARGLPVFSGTLDDIDRTFDVVSLINVLSHLPDVDGFLGEVAPLLKPGGTLVLVTGNGGDLKSAVDYPDRLDLPDHLVFAGKDHVERFLDRAGFTVERVEALRLDTAGWALKAIIKKLLGRPVPLVRPYASPFRDMLYVARRREKA